MPKRQGTVYELLSGDKRKMDFTVTKYLWCAIEYNEDYYIAMAPLQYFL